VSIDLEEDSLQGNGGDVKELEDTEAVMPPKSASKKSAFTEKKTFRKATTASNSIPDLEVNVNNLSLGVPMYNLEYKLPYIISMYNDEVDQRCKVKVYVPTLSKECFVLDVAVGGKVLILKVQVPPFFIDESQVMKSNHGVAGFNQNTHQVQAFKD
jgi:hypothetical protein